MSVQRYGGPARPHDRLSLEKKAWFLCKFLCRTLDEDSFEKIRYHVSICKGVKTKVKLNERGWSTGYKSTSVRHFSHKLPFESFPLEFIENMCQDAMFVNVLLCIFRMQNLPDIQYEIVAYKFTDNATVKRFQDIFQILTGSPQYKTLTAPGSNLTLVPGRSYHMGTLSPDRWGSRDRLVNTGSVAPSEVKVADTGRRPMNGGTRMVLDSEGSWSGGSSLAEDNGTVFRTSDGTVVAQSGGSQYNRGRNGIVLHSVDSYDGPAARRTGGSDPNRKVYSRASERGRTPDPAFTLTRNRYQSTDDASYYGRSRSVDPYGGGSVMNRGYLTSDGRSDIYRPSDAVSVKSQSSYLLSPNFKKVYAPRSAQVNSYSQSSYQHTGPRAYNGSEIKRNGRW